MKLRKFVKNERWQWNERWLLVRNTNRLVNNAKTRIHHRLRIVAEAERQAELEATKSRLKAESDAKLKELAEAERERFVTK